VSGSDVDYSTLGEESERNLSAALLDFPRLVASACEAREPQRLAAYLHETARLAHNWYHKVRVLEAPDGVREARLALARAAQIVLCNGLAILGISAPERM
jgi:arginyl-tRNA synthetase